MTDTGIREYIPVFSISRHATRLLRAAAAVAAAIACAVAQDARPELRVYWSSLHEDNAVVATAASIASLDASCTFVGFNLHAATAPAPGAAAALNVWADAAAGHHITTAGAEGSTWAAANG